MKTLLIGLLVILSGQLIASTRPDSRTLYSCNVDKVFKIDYQTWPKFNLQANDKVSILEQNDNSGDLIALIGDLKIETQDDDRVEERASLSEKSFSIMPNSGEWVMILDIVGNKGLLQYLPTEGNRGAFKKIAEMDCVKY